MISFVNFVKIHTHKNDKFLKDHFLISVFSLAWHVQQSVSKERMKNKEISLFIMFFVSCYENSRETYNFLIAELLNSSFCNIFFFIVCNLLLPICIHSCLWLFFMLILFFLLLLFFFLFHIYSFSFTLFFFFFFVSHINFFSFRFVVVVYKRSLNIYFSHYTYSKQNINFPWNERKKYR